MGNFSPDSEKDVIPRGRGRLAAFSVCFSLLPSLAHSMGIVEVNLQKSTMIKAPAFSWEDQTRGFLRNWKVSRRVRIGRTSEKYPINL